jgi:hypothetical protein
VANRQGNPAVATGRIVGASAPNLKESRALTNQRMRIEVSQWWRATRYSGRMIR